MIIANVLTYPTRLWSSLCSILLDLISHLPMPSSSCGSFGLLSSVGSLLNWTTRFSDFLSLFGSLDFRWWWSPSPIAMIVVRTCIIRICDWFSLIFTLGGMLYVLITFFSGLLMLASAWFFVFDFMAPIINKFIADPSPLENSAPVFMLFLFPFLHLIMSVTQPLSLFTVVFYYLMIPVISLTLPFYSFLHLDDFSCKFHFHVSAWSCILSIWSDRNLRGKSIKQYELI